MHDCLAMRSRGTTLATHFVFTVMPFAWAVPEKTLHALFVVLAWSPQPVVQENMWFMGCCLHAWGQVEANICEWHAPAQASKSWPRVCGQMWTGAAGHLMNADGRRQGRSWLGDGVGLMSSHAATRSSTKRPSACEPMTRRSCAISALPRRTMAR